MTRTLDHYGQNKWEKCYNFRQDYFKRTDKTDFWGEKKSKRRTDQVEIAEHRTLIKKRNTW